MNTLDPSSCSSPSSSSPSRPRPSRRWLKTLWLLFPLLLGTFHLAKGRALLAANHANDLLQKGQTALAQQRWKDAEAAFSEALQTTPPHRSDLLASASAGKARALIQSGEPLEAAELLTPLLEKAETLPNLPPQTLRDLRATTAEARYYAGYSLKLQDASRDLWNSELELARQQLRLLAQDDLDHPHPAHAPEPPPSLLNLEQVLRVERESIHQLQARSVPPPCQNACKKDVLKKKCDRCKNGKKPSDEPESKNGSNTREKYRLESGS